jgi:hypothetical protein
VFFEETEKSREYSNKKCFSSPFYFLKIRFFYLKSVAYPPLDVVESQELSFFWLRTLKDKHKQK